MFRTILLLASCFAFSRAFAPMKGGSPSRFALRDAVEIVETLNDVPPMPIAPPPPKKVRFHQLCISNAFP